MQGFTVIRILLGNDLPVMREIIQCPPHANNQRFYRTENILYVFYYKHY